MKSYFSKLWSKVKHRKGLITAIVISSILTQICFLVLPIGIQLVLDNHVSKLTEDAWYQTTDATSVQIANNKWTQDINLATNTAQKAIVIYQGEQPYFIANISQDTENVEIIDDKVYDFAGVELVDNYTITQLDKAQVKALYETTKTDLQKLFIAFLIIELFFPIAVLINNISTRKFAREVIADFRIAGINKLQKLPIDYFNQRQDGKFISYLISDVSMFYTLASSIGSQLLQAFLMFLGIYIILAFVNIWVFLGALIFLPIIALWIYTFRKNILVHYENARHASSSLNALLNEQFKGIAVIRAFNYEEAAEEEFAQLNGDVYSYNKRSLKIRALSTGSLVNVMRRTMWLAVLLYAGFSFFGQAMAGLTIGTIYLLVSLVNYYVDPMYQFFGIVTMLEQANVSIQRYLRYMDEEEEYEKTDAITTSLPRFSGNVSFEHLTFGYTEGNPVLKDINLQIKANQSVAIVGHTGSGKSSLMNLLMRFYDYKEGKIMVDDYEITSMTRKVYREHIGIILQDPILFKGTLKETITWGDERFSDDDVIMLLKGIGAQDLLEHQDGIYQQVIEMGENFSLGQRQQIAFARAIIQDPSILILDEATANIDTETERKIQNALNYAAQNRTTFVIAHRLSTIQNSDVIVVLDKGVIVEQGTHQALLQHKGKYWEMYNAQKQNT